MNVMYVLVVLMSQVIEKLALNCHSLTVNSSVYAILFYQGSSLTPCGGDLRTKKHRAL